AASRVQSGTRHLAADAAGARAGARRDRASNRKEMSVEKPIAVVLLNMGGPDSLEAVEPFLFNLFNDHDLIPLPLGFLWQRLFARMVSRARAKFVRGYYQLIGGRSPLGEITRAQADALEKRLGPHYRCFVAMRYTPPFTD